MKAHAIFPSQTMLNWNVIGAAQLNSITYNQWLDDPTVADAILDRVVHNAHRLTLRDESLRKTDTAID